MVLGDDEYAEDRGGAKRASDRHRDRDLEGFCGTEATEDQGGARRVKEADEAEGVSD